MAMLVRTVCAGCGEPVVERGRRGYIHRDALPNDIRSREDVTRAIDTGQALCPPAYDGAPRIRMETLTEAI